MSLTGQRRQPHKGTADRTVAAAAAAARNGRGHSSATTRNSATLQPDQTDLAKRFQSLPFRDVIGPMIREELALADGNLALAPVLRCLR